jgi:hypothetical protein
MQWLNFDWYRRPFATAVLPADAALPVVWVPPPLAAALHRRHTPAARLPRMN